MGTNRTKYLSASFLALGVLVATFAVITVFAANVTSSVTVGNATPAASGITVNNGNSITLTASTTQTVNVIFNVSDANGCGDVLNNGTTTVWLYRSGISSSTCFSSPNNANCYSTGISTDTCSIATTTSATATSTFSVWYFAQPTDASSSFNGQTWKATVIVKDAANASSSADSAGVVLNTLNAINVGTTTINYGTVAAGADTGSTNQITSIINVGNSSTTLQLGGLLALTSGSNYLATSSQHYATSTFTFNTADTALSGIAATVGGFSITAPTNTVYYGKNIFWGLGVQSGTASGTYSGTNSFTALWTN